MQLRSFSSLSLYLISPGSPLYFAASMLSHTQSTVSLPQLKSISLRLSFPPRRRLEGDNSHPNPNRSVRARFNASELTSILDRGSRIRERRLHREGENWAYLNKSAFLLGPHHSSSVQPFQRQKVWVRQKRYPQSVMLEHPAFMH